MKANLPLLGLSAVIAFLCVCGAGIFPWAALAAAVLSSAAAWACVRGPRVFDGGNRRAWTSPDAACMAILLLLLLTLLPLPAPLAALAGPERAEQNTRVATALQQAAHLGIAEEGSPWWSFTLNRIGTRRALWLAVLALNCAAMASRLQPRQRQQWVGTLTALGVGTAAAGLVGRWLIPQGYTIWWIFPVPSELPGPLGCFVCPNHFGGWLGMLLPAAAALAWLDARRGRFIAGGAWAVGGAVLCAGVLSSLSRGAILATACGSVFVAIAFAARRRFVASAVLLGTLAALACSFRFVPDGAARERLETLRHPARTQSAQYRMEAWRDTLRVWRAHPIAGIGAESFRMVYPLHRTTSDRAFMTHAENEYVQALAESGLVGLGLLGWLAAAMLAARRRGPTGSVPDRDAGADEAAAVRMAAQGALVVAAVHAAVDFAPHIPLYAASAAGMLGLLATPDRETVETARRPGCLLLAGAALLLSLPLAGPVVARDRPEYIWKATPAETARSLVYAPTSWQDWYMLGRHACRRGTPEARRFGESCLTQAAAYNANHYLLWRELGKLRLRLGDRQGAAAAFKRVRELRDWVPVPTIEEVGP